MTNSPRCDAATAAEQIRERLITMAHASQCPHVGGALSCVDILAVLYWQHLKLEPWSARDIFVLSKGHSCPALYVALVLRGLMDERRLQDYFRRGASLSAHPDRFSTPAVEVSTGSLGHGFNVALGIAAGLHRQGSRRRVFTLLGDGECEEGSIWEGALFAPTLGLTNVTAIIDANGLQYFDRTSAICSLEPLADKWKAFGWHVIEVDGHSTEGVTCALRSEVADKPKVIVARTVKGRGIPAFEHNPSSHTEPVTQEMLDAWRACRVQR